MTIRSDHALNPDCSISGNPFIHILSESFVKSGTTLEHIGALCNQRSKTNGILRKVEELIKAAKDGKSSHEIVFDELLKMVSEENANIIPEAFVSGNACHYFAEQSAKQNAGDTFSPNTCAQSIGSESTNKGKNQKSSLRNNQSDESGNAKPSTKDVLNIPSTGKVITSGDERKGNRSNLNESDVVKQGESGSKTNNPGAKNRGSKECSNGNEVGSTVGENSTFTTTGDKISDSQNQTTSSDPHTSNRKDKAGENDGTPNAQQCKSAPEKSAAMQSPGCSVTNAGVLDGIITQNEKAIQNNAKKISGTTTGQQPNSRTKTPVTETSYPKIPTSSEFGKNPKHSATEASGIKNKSRLQSKPYKKGNSTTKSPVSEIFKHGNFNLPKDLTIRPIYKQTKTITAKTTKKPMESLPTKKRIQSSSVRSSKVELQTGDISSRSSDKGRKMKKQAVHASASTSVKDINVELQFENASTSSSVRSSKVELKTGGMSARSSAKGSKMENQAGNASASTSVKGSNVELQKENASTSASDNGSKEEPQAGNASLSTSIKHSKMECQPAHASNLSVKDNDVDRQSGYIFPEPPAKSIRVDDGIRNDSLNTFAVTRCEKQVDGSIGIFLVNEPGNRFVSGSQTPGSNLLYNDAAGIRQNPHLPTAFPRPIPMEVDDCFLSMGQRQGQASTQQYAKSGKETESGLFDYSSEKKLINEDGNPKVGGNIDAETDSTCPSGSVEGDLSLKHVLISNAEMAQAAVNEINLDVYADEFENMEVASDVEVDIDNIGDLSLLDDDE